MRNVRFLSSNSCDGSLEIWLLDSRSESCASDGGLCARPPPPPLLLAGETGVAGANVTARATPRGPASGLEEDAGDGGRPGRSRWTGGGARGVVLAVDDMGDDGGVSAEKRTVAVDDDATDEADEMRVEGSVGAVLGETMRLPWRAARLAWAAVVDAGADATRLNVRVAGASRGDVAGERWGDA